MNHLSNWIEIPVSDMKRAKKFYSDILGASLSDMNLGDVDYSIFATDDRFNCGALAKGEHYKPSTAGVVIYLDGGDDLSRVLERVKKAGGEVLLEKMFLGDQAGYIGHFIDTEGNRLGVHSMT